MKVLNCFLDNRFGGPQKRAYEVAENLKKHRIETIFLFNEKRKNNNPIKNSNCYLLKHLHYASLSKTISDLILFCLSFPYNLCKICRIIKLEKIDVVHTNGSMNILPVLAAKLTHTKLIWHINDTICPGWIKKAYASLIFLLSDRIAVAAEAVGKYYFGNINGYKKTFVLYAPVDTNKFRRELANTQEVVNLRKDLDISDNELVIGAIGNINKAKGYEYFVEAAHILKARRVRAKFLILGSKLDSAAGYYKKIQNLIRARHLEKDVTLVGFTESVREFLAVFDLFVLPSVTEACPIAVLEALAMKVPVVATNVGGVCEQIIDGRSGFIVEPRNPEQLADAIQKSLALPRKDLDKIADSGREKAEKIFSLDTITKKHKDIYEALAKCIS